MIDLIDDETNNYVKPSFKLVFITLHSFQS